MRYKISKEKQKIILRNTVIVGIFAWTFLGIGFYSLSAKRQPIIQAQVVENNSIEEIVPESSFDHCENGFCSAVCVKLNDALSSNTRKCDESKTEPEKIVAKPIIRKIVQPAPKNNNAPGVRFTNDRNLVSCKNNSSNHDKSVHGKGKHYDEDCCIDKDEWLMPGCVYYRDDAKYSLSGKKPAPLHVPVRK